VREFESLIINQEMAQTLLDEHLQKYAHLSSDIQTIKL
jgi:recombinational DNA repair protein RecT